jgi:hypothetical protein
MSFRTPKLRKQGRQLSPSASASPSASRSASPSKAPSVHRLISPTLVPKQRRPRNSQGIFIQSPEVLVTVPGHDYSQMPIPDRGRMPRAARAAGTSRTTHNIPDATIDEGYEHPVFDIDDIFVERRMDPEDTQNEGQRRKRETQWRKWINEVIPSMLAPHLRLLRESASLRSISRSGSDNCTCGHVGSRHLQVVCVHFESK